MDTSTMDLLDAKLAMELQIEDLDADIDATLPDLSPQHTAMMEQHRNHKERLVYQLEMLHAQTEFYTTIEKDRQDSLADPALSQEDRQAIIDGELLARLEKTSIRDDIPDETEGGSVCSVESHGELDQLSDPEDEEECRSCVIATPAASEAEPGSDDAGMAKEGVTSCSVCLDSMPTENTQTLECEPDPHTYCHGCLLDLFETSVFKDTSLFPPRCCRKVIPLDVGRKLLSQDLIKEFDVKVEELSSLNPTFCSNRECAKYIRDSEINHNVGTCLFCTAKTCTTCNGKEHDEELCPQDQDTIALQDEARRSRWQQCAECKNMVELSAGCFHITCRCSHQFCYLCGAKWKTCSCVQFEEQFVINQDAVIAGVPPPNPVPCVAAAERPCGHNWSQERGPNCEDCGADYLPYIMRCDICNVAMCWRCIRNRAR